MKFPISTQIFIRTNWLVRKADGMIRRTKQWPLTSGRKCASRIAPSACQPNKELTANIIITTFTTCTATLKLWPLKGTDLTWLNGGIINLHISTTNSSLRQVTGKRSMVLSRSTFSGSGKYTGHWLGDNFSRWSNMADSIIGTQLN